MSKPIQRLVYWIFSSLAEWCKLHWTELTIFLDESKTWQGQQEEGKQPWEGVTIHARFYRVFFFLIWQKKLFDFWSATSGEGTVQERVDDVPRQIGWGRESLLWSISSQQFFFFTTSPVTKDKNCLFLSSTQLVSFCVCGKEQSLSSYLLTKYEISKHIH